VLFALCILAAFVQPAAAHYDPKLGRWLERDPIGSRPGRPMRAVRIGSYAPVMAIAPRIGSGSIRPTLQYSDGMNLYEYSRSQPTISFDPYGLDCFVWLKCTLTGSKFKDNWFPKKNVRTCFYNCIESSPDGRPSREQGSHFTLLCSDIPTGVVIQQEKEYKGRWKCKACPKSYFVRKYFLDSFPYGNCSRSNCKASCQKAGGAKFLCKKLSPPLKQMCNAMVKLGTYNCKEICDAFCKNR
jgi:hypothetical protein